MYGYSGLASVSFLIPVVTLVRRQVDTGTGWKNVSPIRPSWRQASPSPPQNEYYTGRAARRYVMIIYVGELKYDFVYILPLWKRILNHMYIWVCVWGCRAGGDVKTKSKHIWSWRGWRRPVTVDKLFTKCITSTGTNARTQDIFSKKYILQNSAFVLIYVTFTCT